MFKQVIWDKFRRRTGKVNMEEFNILTDNGKRFCSCKFENGSILFKGKNGNVDLESLMQQLIVKDPSLPGNKQRMNRERGRKN